MIDDDDIAFVYVNDSNNSRSNNVKRQSAKAATKLLKVKSSDVRTYRMPATTCMLANSRVLKLLKTS